MFAQKGVEYNGFGHGGRLKAVLAMALLLVMIFTLSIALDGVLHFPSRRQRDIALASRNRVVLLNRPQRLIDAPFIDQRGDYPTGCESVTAVMALQQAGVNISTDRFIEGFLPRGNAPYGPADSRLGSDPWQVFLGDPRSEEGWGCYAPVIEQALEGALAQTDLRPLALYGESLDALCRDYVDKGIPLMLWVTADMATPVRSESWALEETGEQFTWIYPLHCMLLVGYDQEGYYFNDPLRGKQVWYPAQDTRRAYEGVHSQAIALGKR